MRRSLAVVGVTSLLAALLGAWAWTAAAVDLRRFAIPSDPRVVADRHGAPLGVVRAGVVDARWVALHDLAPHVTLAFLAAEDARFFAHGAIDPRATLRAVADTLLPWRHASGGSTITQQLVKLTHGRPHGVWSKPLEMVRAVRLARLISKDAVLEQYLNRVPFGHSVVGVARASEVFLGHGPEGLSVAEAALLAALPQGPSRLDPALHPSRARARRDRILRRMAAQGALDAAALAAALDEPIRWNVDVHPREAERFVPLALRGSAPTEQRLVTSLDLALQRHAEGVLARALAAWRERGATNAAGLVLGTATGEVLAYVGASDRSGPGGATDLLRQRRQPGSTLKPFVYELLFEAGGSPETVLSDVRRPLRGAGGATVDARDYDDRERGPVPARDALAASLNLAALDAATRVGPEAIVRRLRSLGFEVPGDAERYGAGIVLGGVDVTALELARADAALLRGGLATDLSFVPRTAHAGGGAAVMERMASAVTADVLRDEAARARGFGRSLRDLAPNAPFVLKTGTSSRWRDAWCVVGDARFVAVVWLGDPEGRPTAGVSGFEAAAPAAVRLLAAARELLPTMIAVAPVEAGPTAPPAMPTPAAAAAALASWADRARPAHFSGTPRRSESVRLVDPVQGRSVLLVEGASLPLRATACDGGSSPAFFVDGRPLAGSAWAAAPGVHVFAAACGASRSPPVAVTVEVRSIGAAQRPSAARTDASSAPSRVPASVPSAPSSSTNSSS